MKRRSSYSSKRTYAKKAKGKYIKKKSPFKKPHKVYKKYVSGLVRKHANPIAAIIGLASDGVPIKFSKKFVEQMADTLGGTGPGNKRNGTSLADGIYELLATGVVTGLAARKVYKGISGDVSDAMAAEQVARAVIENPRGVYSMVSDYVSKGFTDAKAIIDMVTYKIVSTTAPYVVGVGAAHLAHKSRGMMGGIVDHTLA